MVPRIASYLVHNCRGGYFDVQPRNAKIPPIRVDAVPAHAIKTDNDLIQKNGICFPIRNNH
jgi:hypothetical protein